MKKEHSINEGNGLYNIVAWEELNSERELLLMSFFRRIDLPHLYYERILPIFQRGPSLVVAALNVRPSPEWGKGEQKIRAVMQAPPDKVGKGAYLSAIFVNNEDITNIGLISAVYKETLEQLRKKERPNVYYFVHEDSVMARRVLLANEFSKTEESYLYEGGRYFMYKADVSELLKQGLDTVSADDLIALEVDDDLFERIVLFQGMMQLATRAEPHEIVAKPMPG